MDRIVGTKIKTVPAANRPRAKLKNHLERVSCILRAWVQEIVDVDLCAVQVPRPYEEALRKMNA